MSTDSAPAPVSLTPTEDKILRQIEFYFSNSNLPKDKFLRDLYMSDADHWVPIPVLATFKRVQNICTNLEEIVAALRKSSSLRVSADGSQVTRVEPLPEQFNNNKSTIYCKGFPEEPESSIDSIAEFFAPHGKVLAVRLRRIPGAEKKFKGSAFIEFSTPEEAEAVAAKELKWPGKEENLLILTKAAYSAKKAAEDEAKGGKKGTKRKDRDEETPQPEKTFKKGLLLRITEIGPESTRESIKALLGSVEAEVAYVDYSKGEPAATVRMQEESKIDAQAAAEKLTQSATKLDEKAVVFKALEGEEEQQYWTSLWEAQANKKQRGGGRGGRGGRGRGRGRGRR